MKKGFILFISCAMLMLVACDKDKKNKPETITGESSAPAWSSPVDYDMTSSMTAVVRVDLAISYSEQVAALGKEYITDGDMLAAFSGDVCLGVDTMKQENNGLFFLFITAPESTDNNVQLKYYSSVLKNIFIASEPLTFRNDDVLGTVSEPLTPVFVKEK